MKASGGSRSGGGRPDLAPTHFINKEMVRPQERRPLGAVKLAISYLIGAQ